MYKVGDEVRIIRNEYCEYGWVDEMNGYIGKVATITHIDADGAYCVDADNGFYIWDSGCFEPVTSIDDKVLFAKLRPDAKIPTKRDEDGGYDVYPVFDEDYIVIHPHETKKFNTGIISAFDKKYRAVLAERGSTGVIGMGQRAGVIDSGYRGEWIVPITNHGNLPIVIAKHNVTMPEVMHKAYPVEKAICQVLFEEVPVLEISEASVDEVMSIESERGDGKLGSSGK